MSNTDIVWLDKRALLLLHEEGLAVFGGLRGLRDEGLLESALARPQQILNYQQDASLAQLAAAYAVGIARNHPFNDGNKRAAFLTCVAFLHRQGYTLTVEQHIATAAMLALASGDLEENAFTQWVDDHLEELR
jgi:death-on-curing protein